MFAIISYARAMYLVNKCGAPLLCNWCFLATTFTDSFKWSYVVFIQLHSIDVTKVSSFLLVS